jgi:hypothetical protein
MVVRGERRWTEMLEHEERNYVQQSQDLGMRLEQRKNEYLAKRVPFNR